MDSLVDAMLHGRPLPMPVIDIHAHMGLLNVFWMPHNDAAGLVEEMDALGVAATAVSSHSAISSDMSVGNDEVARACAAFPGRIIGYAFANPHYPELVEDELKRCFDDLGFRMIKIHPGIHMYPLNGKLYEKIYRFAEERGAPVLTHTWQGDANCSPDVAAEVARRYPSVPWLWGHSGGNSFDRALDLAAELPNVYLDLASSFVVNGQLEMFVSRAPVERIVFSSDMPFLSLPQQIAKVVFSDIPEDAKRKVLHDNSAAILESAGITAP
jgi:hypothetical protein